jgi:hypothetical protein
MREALTAYSRAPHEFDHNIDADGQYLFVCFSVGFTCGLNTTGRNFWSVQMSH